MSNPENPADLSDSSDLRYNMTLGALGIVYGDIGTSPLYAMHVALGDLTATPLNIMGILSLIFWSLIIVISFKYIGIIFKADNNGEGGIMALLALLKQKITDQRTIYLMAIFGAGLLLGDAMLTPAISVTSAVEGLNVIAPDLSVYILPISCAIILGLFFIQRSGSSKLGAAFGPLILLWFLSIALTGSLKLLENPMVLQAINPWYAFNFLVINGWHGYILLGGVFLVVTGGEALYADLGHFGKNPIRRSWFFIVLPCLLLNYFGQGAWLIVHPDAIINPFYMIVPESLFIPILIIATLATIIASQAVIAATFSLSRQAVLLGLYPKMPIIHTDNRYGQIYIPQMNYLLLAGTLILILTFNNASNLAHAYGIAVNMEMLLVTCMVAAAAIKVWEWSWFRTFFVFSLFLLIDLAFLGANFHKFLTGGWLPLVFALFVSVIMYTWNAGLTFLTESYYVGKKELNKMVKQLHYRSLHRVPDVTAIFITDVYDMSGGAFLHFLKLTQTVPENILIVSYTVENIPHVPYKNHFELLTLDEDIIQLILHFGFMDIISIPQALYVANDRGLLPFPIDVDKTTYFIDIPNIIASKAKQSLPFHWQEKLFAFLMRNYSAHLNIEFYQLPYNRTVGIGSYCII